MIRNAPSLGATVGVLGAVVFLALAGLGPTEGQGRGIAHAQPAVKVGVTISTRLVSPTRGTFTLGGGLESDHGSVGLFQQQVGGAAKTSVRLRGARGVIVLSSSQACAKTRGTWRVVSGTGSYKGISGTGTMVGRAACGRFRPSTVVYRGTVDVPPPPLAQPGSYGGWTAQNTAFLFDVAPDGRAIANVLIGGYRYECIRSDGLRSPAGSAIDAVFAGPFPIADDRTFTFNAGPVTTVTGRFTSSGAEGTIAVAYTLPPEFNGRTTSCSGSVTWTATMPPPPPRRALAGTYCGFSTIGEGACMDVGENGREVRNFRVGVLLRCGETNFVVRVVYDDLLPLRTDLSFEGRYTQQIEDGSARAFVSGTFDQAGGMTGRYTIQPLSLTYEGVRYTCTGGGAAFTARLQR